MKAMTRVEISIVGLFIGFVVLKVESFFSRLDAIEYLFIPMPSPIDQIVVYIIISVYPTQSFLAD
jgi:hypothetical protein